MLLGIAEQFTSTTDLDSQLTAVPTSGMYYNSGVHPSINVDNILHFLPNVDFTFADYVAGATYGKYSDTRIKTDIVTYNSLVYESLVTSNTGNTPDSSPTQWLETNIESLRLKAFIQSVEDRVLSDLNLIRRQVDSQYLYNLVEQNSQLTATTLPNDYAAWVFEPKGTDYVEFEINQMALQATTDTPQSLYVINQGQLVTTLTLNPNASGRLEFEDINYTFSGKGIWIFAIDSQDVLVDGGSIDPLKFDGFVAYTATGIGGTPEGATYSFGSNGNGLSFNVSVHLSPTQYVTNNLKNFGNLLQAGFELEAFKMFQMNAHNRSNRQERIQMTDQLLSIETRELNHNTSAKRYHDAKRKAISQIEKTFDRKLSENDDELEISISSY